MPLGLQLGEVGPEVPDQLDRPRAHRSWVPIWAHLQGPFGRGQPCRALPYVPDPAYSAPWMQHRRDSAAVGGKWGEGRKREGGES